MKKIIITGISSGLGFELSKLFLENDYYVIGLSKREPKEFKENKNFYFIKTNLNCNKSIQRSIDEIKNPENKISKFDYIFLNAGIWKFEMIEELNFKKVDEIIKTNLSSNIKLISGLFNEIIKNKSKIFISGSINWKNPEINQISYNISKGALKSLSDSLKIELEEYGLKDNIKYLELNDFNSNLVKIKVKENKKKIISAFEIAKKIFEEYF